MSVENPVEIRVGPYVFDVPALPEGFDYETTRRPNGALAVEAIRGGRVVATEVVLPQALDHGDIVREAFVTVADKARWASEGRQDDAYVGRWPRCPPVRPRARAALPPRPFRPHARRPLAALSRATVGADLGSLPPVRRRPVRGH